jgi:ArsR family transcriptional regulator
MRICDISIDAEHICQDAYIFGIIMAMAPRTAKFSLDGLFRALSDRTRLRILNLVKDKEVCVCDFASIFGTNQPKVSRHLAYLRRAGLVHARRDGKWMHYSLLKPSDATGASVLNEAFRALQNDPQISKDNKKLSVVCCVPSQLVNIKNAAKTTK